MTLDRTHQITPTLIGDGPWGDGRALLDPQGQGSGTRPPASSAPPSSPAAPGQRALPAQAGNHRLARCALRPQPCAVKAARDFARATLGQWQANRLFDDAAVVISELVTNAVRYGRRAGLVRSAPDARLELVLMRRDGCLVCVVTDPNPGPPVRMEPDYVAETGRGLCVVESLSKQWGWTPLATDRKAVWAALALPGGL
jgi:anti-sigma regulatory factor (Ser/Thr protein kinase)